MPDVHRGIVIGVEGETAVIANELALTLAIGLLAVPTPAARTGRVAGVHPDHGDARPFGLVADEGLQLREGPARVPGSVPSPNCDPLADMGQVLQTDPAGGVLGGCDQLVR